MASNIFRQFSAEGGIFSDESFLRPEYLPDELPGREKQMRELASYLQEAAKGRSPPSVLIMGPPGVGKTSSSRLVLKQLSEVSGKALPIYINCWENSTRFGILNQLIISLGDMMPRRGIATDELVSRLAEIGRRQGMEKIPIIILDEADRLVASQTHEDQILYDLSRAGEALGLKCGVIAITNDEQIALKLDARVRSSLTNNQIVYKAYNPTELKSILNERAKKALNPSAYDADVIGVCAAVGAKSGGDARVAIQLLWSSGKLAEREGAKKITPAHVKAAQASTIEQAATPAARKSEGLDEIDKKIIEIVRKGGDAGADSGIIYSKFGATDGEQRNFRLRLARLEKGGLIIGEEIAKGAGHSKKWKLKKTA